MRDKGKKILIISLIIGVCNSPVFAESLFRTGISDNSYFAQPKTLFGTVKARAIGDIVTVSINQDFTTSNTVKYDTKKSSSLTDNYSNKINHTGIIPFIRIPNLDGFGGESATGNSASSSRTTKFTDTITAQVVQVLPNGNLVIQGKKTSVDSGDNVSIVLSGIVDPRLIDSTGKIDSTLVANLQIGVVGKGSVSRADSEGTVTKLMRYLF